jgi:hypothetical protein
MQEANTGCPSAANGGRAWARSDDEFLKLSLRGGATPGEIAVRLKRDVNDVFKRLAALAVENQHAR